MDSTLLISNYSTKTVGNYLLEIFDNKKEKHITYIACAYFNHCEVLEEIHQASTQIQMVVLLDKGTSPSSLHKALALPKLEIRYFTSRFHSKFYLSKDYKAIIGSANFTQAGLGNNEEVCVLTSSKNILTDLQKIFENYWRDAHVLTSQVLCSFEEYIRSTENTDKKAMTDFKNNVGDVSPCNEEISNSKLIEYKRKIQKKQNEISQEKSQMDPDKRDFVFFIMDEAVEYLLKHGGSCKKDEFRGHVYRSYNKPIKGEWESNTKNTFGWAFNKLYYLGITKRSTGKTKPYELREDPNS